MGCGCIESTSAPIPGPSLWFAYCSANGTTSSSQWSFSCFTGVLLSISVLIVVVVVVEEDTIAFASDLSKDCGRGVRGGRDKFKSPPSCRPANGSGVLNEITDKLVCFVAGLDSSRHATPTYVIGNGCGY